MPPKQEKPAGAAGGSRRRAKAIPPQDETPLDIVENPPVIGRYVRLNSKGLKCTAYEELQESEVYPYIYEINRDGTVELLWQTRLGGWHTLDVLMGCLCYTIAVPGVHIREDETLAEIQRRQAEKQQATDAKTKSEQDKQRALEKAKFDAEKAACRLEAQKLLANKQTENLQAKLALQLEKKREDRLEVQLSVNLKLQKEIEKLKAHLKAEKAKPAQPAQSAPQAPSQQEVDSLYATITDLKAQLTALTTGPARKNNEEVHELRNII
jgi:hypothetical protein